MWLVLSVDRKPTGAMGDDKYWPINDLMSHFNNHYHRVLVMGPTVVFDKSMWWHFSQKLPHKMNISWKPQSIGSEVKDMACGETKVVTTIEVMHEKEYSRNLSFVDEVGPAAAVLMCGVSSAGIEGTRRIVIADSDFGNLCLAHCL